MKLKVIFKTLLVATFLFVGISANAESPAIVLNPGQSTPDGQYICGAGTASAASVHQRPHCEIRRGAAVGDISVWVQITPGEQWQRIAAQGCFCTASGLWDSLKRQAQEIYPDCIFPASQAD